MLLAEVFTVVAALPVVSDFTCENREAGRKKMLTISKALIAVAFCEYRIKLFEIISVNIFIIFDEIIFVSSIIAFGCFR
jgi:hypothetical protein